MKHGVNEHQIWLIYLIEICSWALAPVQAATLFLRTCHFLGKSLTLSEDFIKLEKLLIAAKTRPGIVECLGCGTGTSLHPEGCLLLVCSLFGCTTELHLANECRCKFCVALPFYFYYLWVAQRTEALNPSYLT